MGGFMSGCQYCVYCTYFLPLRRKSVLCKQCFCSSSLISKCFFSCCDVSFFRGIISSRLCLHLSLQWINTRAIAEVCILSGFPEGILFGQRRLGCPGSCVMDGGIMGPSDRGIIAAALHRWDLSPSRLPVNYVSSCLVCSCSSLGSGGCLALMWLPLPSRVYVSWRETWWQWSNQGAVAKVDKVGGVVFSGIEDLPLSRFVLLV